MAVGSNEPVVGASEVRKLEDRVRNLERLLGRKTMENEILKEALDVARGGEAVDALADGVQLLARGEAVELGLTPLVEGITMVVNYGTNKVRFPAPVPVGSRLRAGLALKSAEEVPGGVQLISDVTIEREGGDKPVCVAETVSLLFV